MKLFIDAVWESLYHYGEELCGDKVEIVRNDDFFLMVLAGRPWQRRKSQHSLHAYQ